MISKDESELTTYLGDITDLFLYSETHTGSWLRYILCPLAHCSISFLYCIFYLTAQKE